MQKTVNIFGGIFLAILVTIRILLAVTVAHPGVVPSLDPPPAPSPIQVADFRVLLIHEESGENSQLVESCLHWFLENAKGKYAIRDDDATDETLKNDLDWVRAAYALPRTTSPWLVVGTPSKGGYSGPLPADLPSFVALMSRFCNG